MLRSLLVRDYVIVAEAEILFDEGFTVFSGETGAGKSILIDALALALGERGDVGCVREGATRAEITAIFDVPQTLSGWLQEHDLDADDELTLRRVIDSQGKSRGYINGSPATIKQLQEIGEHLVDIHGQHAHQSLLKAASQRDMLDTHGGLQALRDSVAQAWKAWRAVSRRRQAALEDAGSLAAEREKTEWQIAQLDALDLKPGEWEQLTEEHQRLAHGQALIDGAASALIALDEGDDSAQQRVHASAHRIGQLIKHDVRLQPVYEALDSARIAVNEAISDLNAYVSAMELDPARLAEVESRMGAAFELSRRFRVEPERLSEWRESLAQTLGQLADAADLEALTREEAEREKHYLAMAQALSDARKTAAESLSNEVSDIMQTLAMQGGQFEATLQACSPGASGLEEIQFLVAGHGGVPTRPLSKVASGGELARISLALSVVATRAARVPTLIFDEVDTGIGGAVAEVVGNLLRALGTRHQVLCVTHLPQVASRGMRHFQVSKHTEGSGTTSRITALDQSARVEEIARMLGGLNITATTRKHAREMLHP